MYQFNPLKLYTRLVPWFLRRPVFGSWLKVLASALEYVQGLLLSFVNSTTYDMLFNAQVIYLEHVLNETFSSSPEIYIENVFLPPLYKYNDSEAQPALYLRNESEVADPLHMRNVQEFASSTQYIVHVDADLAGEVAEIEALINLYNLAGVPYEIQFDL